MGQDQARRDHHVDAVLESLSTMERHVDSEYVDDLPETLASVSRQPRYAMMPEPGVVSVICDSEGVADFYGARDTVFIPSAGRVVAQVATDWYVFLENVPSRIVVATGKPRTLHTATLFPISPDGITGEFLWERSPASLPTAPELPGESVPVPRAAARNLANHERYLGALCRADVDLITSLVNERCIGATRNYLPDARARPMRKFQRRSEFLDGIREWLECFELERVSVLNRIVTDWYVFAEELLVVRRKGRNGTDVRQQYRKASIYAITPEGLIEGELSYGTDIEPASALADRTLGAAFWSRADAVRKPDPSLTRRNG